MEFGEILLKGFLETVGELFGLPSAVHIEFRVFRCFRVLVEFRFRAAGVAFDDTP